MSSTLNHQTLPYSIIHNQSEQPIVSSSNGQSIPKESNKLDHNIQISTDRSLQNSCIVTRHFYRFRHATQVCCIITLFDPHRNTLKSLLHEFTRIKPDKSCVDVH